MAKLNLCFEIDQKPWPIKLEQYGNKNLFRVSYGYQIDDKLNYAEAAAKLGQAIMHYAACDDRLNMKEI